MSYQEGPVTGASPSQLPWYGITTRPNREKSVTTVLEAMGYEHFLPTYRVRRRWSDRVVESEVPLFPGYTFCRFDSSKKLPIVSTSGVVAVVAFGKVPSPIPEHEISALKAVLKAGLIPEPHAFLSEGRRVRVKSGSLSGLEGIVVKRKSEFRIVISVALLQRSVSVEVESDWLQQI